MCVSQLAQHVHDNLALWPVIKEALDLPTPCHHGRRWLVTSQEAGGGLAQRLLLRIAATCFSHLLFTFSPSPSISLSSSAANSFRTDNTCSPLPSSVLWVRQIYMEGTENLMVLHKCTQVMQWVRALTKYSFQIWQKYHSYYTWMNWLIIWTAYWPELTKKNQQKR